VSRGYCDNCTCNDCAVGRQRAYEREHRVSLDARRAAKAGLAWMISLCGASWPRIGAAFGTNARWAEKETESVRERLDRSVIPIFYDGSGSTRRLRIAQALPSSFPYSLFDVDIPDPEYRGEPNPSTPSAPTATVKR
jgi:hypothetical protein